MRLARPVRGANCTTRTVPLRSPATDSKILRLDCAWSCIQRPRLRCRQRATR